MRGKTKSIILLLTIFFCFSSCKNIQNQSPQQKEKIAVTVMTVSYEAAESTNTYISSISPSKTTTIRTRNSGSIARINIAQGDIVSKDQVLAVIDSPTINSAYNIAQSNLKQAEDGYRRAKKVYDAGSISEVQMVDIQTKYDQAKSSAEAATNALNHCTIKAPFDAYVEELYIENGDELDNLQAIAKLVSINDMELLFSVSEKEISEIKEGQKLLVEIPSLNLKNIKATIITKGVSASALSHSYTCRATLDKANRAILPGMVCKISLVSQDNNIIVPSSVLLTDRDGRYLWVVDNGIVRKQHVDIQGFSSKGIIISDGLNEGDQVIVEGYQKVSSGMEVIAR